MNGRNNPGIQFVAAIRRLQRTPGAFSSDPLEAWATATAAMDREHIPSASTQDLPGLLEKLPSLSDIPTTNLTARAAVHHRLIFLSAFLLREHFPALHLLAHAHDFWENRYLGDYTQHLWRPPVLFDPEGLLGKRVSV